MRYIDLRSDTVTQPTQAMREAMFNARVGDDVYGDDPTVNELEALAAKMLGKQAALLVASGTMGNQVAVMTHVARGGEVICASDCHIMAHEVGAAAALSGAHMCGIEFDDGVPDPGRIARAIRGEDIHYPPTQLILVEQALGNGRVVPLETLQQIKALAGLRGIPVHMDGARLFNAATALGVPASELAACADSVSVCLSKGLCAPVGSVLAGSAAFVARARKNRKMVGGGMRQAGFLAAAGILALTEMTKRLGDDHDNARHLASALDKLPDVSVDIKGVQISMVFFRIDRDDAFLDALPEKLREKGVLMNGHESGVFRMVTHHGVSRADIEHTVRALAELL